jgi:hypothetical protein
MRNVSFVLQQCKWTINEGVLEQPRYAESQVSPITRDKFRNGLAYKALYCAIVSWRESGESV